MVRIMKAIQNLPIANSPEEPMTLSCKHTRVRVVAREDDVEFVECQECGDVFEASEFTDMAIEENIRPEDT
jgi:Zn ribbon nucleic-acid-binding protein